MHDWTKVRAGTYHNFHYRWIAAIMDRLNAGLLPEGLFAMAEQVVGGPEPDVVTLKKSSIEFANTSMTGVVASQATKPVTSFVMKAETERYARKANRIVVKHELGDVVAVIEIVSPGNKDSRHAIFSFIEKSVQLVFDEINLLILDPFPPGPRDPQGIHSLVWSEITNQEFELPANRELTMVSYQSAPIKTAFVEPISVGMPLPDMPLFLKDACYVNVPLEQTYSDTWDVLPNELKKLVW